MRRIRLILACPAALAVASCGGPPDRRAILAQTWTCEMTTVVNDLTSDYREVVSFRPNGEYQTKATVVATNATMQATMNMEWNGRWRLSEDTFEREFIGIKAVSGDYGGIPMTQDRLDAAAEAFRSAPTSERGTITTLNETQLVIESGANALTCTR